MGTVSIIDANGDTKYLKTEGAGTEVAHAYQESDTHIRVKIHFIDEDMVTVTDISHQARFSLLVH